jgi:hypothetical protein
MDFFVIVWLFRDFLIKWEIDLGGFTPCCRPGSGDVLLKHVLFWNQNGDWQLSNILQGENIEKVFDRPWIPKNFLKAFRILGFTVESRIS